LLISAEHFFHTFRHRGFAFRHRASRASQYADIGTAIAFLKVTLRTNASAQPS
jgi:hypothetical protein